MVKKRCLCIIPARGGSKRIPHKNIIDFLGKPLIAYSILAIQEAGIADTIMVSTDDEEIANVAIKYGAEVPFYREPQLADDKTGIAEVLINVVERYKDAGTTYDYVICLLASSPLIQAKSLVEAFNKLLRQCDKDDKSDKDDKNNKFDSICPVESFSYPPQRCLVVRDGKLEMLHPEHYLTRSQDLEKLYHDCGQFFIFKTEALLRDRKLYTQNAMPFYLSELESQDIDNYTDLEMAKAKYKLLHSADNFHDNFHKHESEKSTEPEPEPESEQQRSEINEINEIKEINEQNEIIVLFTAAGSIGSRHIKNLADVCRSLNIHLSVDVIRKSDRVLPQEIKTLIRQEIREDSELQNQYDVVFITDETKTHYENIIKFKSRCKHMFIEKPILDNISYDFTKIKPERGSIYYVACPIRFSKYFEELKKVVENNEIFSARIIFSSYMPNWQKGRDYRLSFRCFTERGGGVDIDSLHEIDYMTALFGKPDNVERLAGKYSNLEMNAPDLAVYLFDYGDKVIEMHLDYFGRVNNRRVEFYAKDDVIVVDYNKHTVEHQLNGEVYDFGIDDQFYQKEMQYFISLITGKVTENINDVQKALASLRLAKGLN